MKFLVVLINLVFTAFALFFCVKGFYKMLDAELKMEICHTRPLAPVTEKMMLNSRGQYPEKHFQKIVNRNIFNAALADSREKGAFSEKISSSEIERMEKTDLDLTLLGTVTGDQKQAFAVIEDKKAKGQFLYKTGDTIQSARIKIILRHRVVLSNNGRDQVLEMDLKDKGSQTNLPVKDPGSGPSETISVDRSLVEESMSNINTLMKQVRIRPHFENGRPDGLLVYGISPNSLFRKMGLRNGDIIMGVDGRTIQSVDDALSLYDNLKNAGNLDMQIKRRGRLKEIHYNVQ
ncbi:MAG: type II secretion system protein N [Thermodesulfobacteriota bacterium]|nr:type II secretion system protein N [Thermodesulfobacteriota bacterium]